MLSSPRKPYGKNRSAKRFKGERWNTQNTKIAENSQDTPANKNNNSSDRSSDKLNLKVEFTNYFSNFIAEVQKSNVDLMNEEKKNIKKKPKVIIQRTSNVVYPKNRFTQISSALKYQSSKNKQIKILDNDNDLKAQLSEEIKEINDNSQNLTSLILKRPNYDEKFIISNWKILK